MSGEMWNLSPLAYEVATMPSAILIVNIEALIGPKISSTLPTWVLFSRKMGPLKYGTCACVERGRRWDEVRKKSHHERIYFLRWENRRRSVPFR